MEDKLILRGATVVFANLADEGFGRSITLDATDKEVNKAITNWVKVNNIGKGDKAGRPNFKEYEGKTQYAFKISDYTRFAGLNGLSEKDLGFGATVSLVANAFIYDNKFGTGVSGSLSAVVIEKRASTSADADLEELMGAEPLPTSLPPADQYGNQDAEINLDEIPFG